MDATDPVVATTRGRVRGFTRGTTAVFLGIPFAQAPVGPLRFAAPVPPEPWEGELDATAYGATAQRGDTGITLIPEPSVLGDATLNVNVFAPVDATPDAALPVFVWIHGGGFVSGSPASRWYDGDAFARDGVVTVVLSYRLGFDGFGWIDGAPSNRGLRDQIAALEWVRDEIGAFGGDPARVTVAGQSAGGGSVLALLASPAASGLFARAMALSPAVGAVSGAAARRFAGRLADLAGVRPDREGFATLPEERLLALQRLAQKPERRARLTGLTALLDDGLPLGPVIDGDLLPRSPFEALADGASADVPVVVGATDDEFTMVTARWRKPLRLVPVPLALAMLGLGRSRRRAYLARSRRRGAAARLGGYVSDRVIRSVVLRTARTRGGAATWVYRFAWRSPSIGFACHCLDVPFWFDHLDAEGVTTIAGDVPPADLAAAMHEAAVRFARDGDPGWPTWDATARRARVFGAPASAPPVEPDAYSDVAPLV
ncbi:MAG: carboxylesterase [Microbacterium sp. 71-36]|uniref:carboxylesterase/lipase family protein n=1 Tax=unclassified Microbacterium TaxID=2609290 RepID=UPI0008688B8F|nr:MULTISPECIES: carboxylesterase family protein [unclassified Microbacterium]MBN9213153.1 carboxylesterase family protein [Microbacterium sp.]ODT40148.1 MAG: carboxylesterase [Microbacterium sp. SCN 71-17]ODU48682.1 MAG: carboxylesterase [Microbacterium sp. SCN 70-10]OJV78142.1 MAG: carboxylesterase [Microbacterium sp. 71-36]